MTDQATITLDTSVGAIAEALPGAAQIFRQAGIGFCCGGDETLRDACAHQGADPVATLDALLHLQARAGALPPEAADSPALIDHILDRFHATHREELAWLIPMAQKVETVHGDHEEAPLGLTAALIALADDLESHMQKEEQVLFPMIRGGGHPMIAHPIAAMRAEHAEADHLLGQVLQVTRNLDLPVGACRSWTALYTGLRKFADDLAAHMALENDVLFARYAA
jgi:regulator of cell morphogenesis and NO signaling